MTQQETSDELFKRIDTNQDGTIDRGEFRDWYFNPGGAVTHYKYGYGYDDSGSTYDRYGSYGLSVANRYWTSDTAINTSSLQETEEYLRRTASNVYIDVNPQIIRRTAKDGPITLEQRVLVRYLQPPPVPEPGPLIIRQVRPPQPPAPPALVIREHARHLPSPPPLILRERPPTPPPHIPSETKTEYLPPIPVPPRSVIIERYPPPPEKPRDIIIERWIPYGERPARRTIVEPAPPAIEYPKPFHQIIVYDTLQTRITRRFEKHGVTHENPESYISRYGSSLLDPVTLVQEARRAGVIEDITPPLPSSSIYRSIRGHNYDYDQNDQIIEQSYSTSRVINDLRGDGITYQEETRRFP